MSSRRTGARPAAERLEARAALSAAPINAIGVADGAVAAPRSVADVSVPVSARNLARHKPNTVINVQVQPTGGGLDPAVVAALGPGGARLPFRAAPFNARSNIPASAYA